MEEFRSKQVQVQHVKRAAQDYRLSLRHLYLAIRHFVCSHTTSKHLNLTKSYLDTQTPQKSTVRVSFGAPWGECGWVIS